VSYIAETLLPDEHVVYRTALHWIIFARAALVLVAGVVLIAFPKVQLVGAAVLVLGAALMVPPLVAYLTTELGVTNKRLIVKVGFVRRRTFELLLRQVEALSVDQTLAGRLLGYGSITLSGTGVREIFHRSASRSSYAAASRARSLSRLLRRAHLLRWRPRRRAHRTASTPRAQLSGAASQLDPSEQPAATAAAGRRCRRRW
jgi:hypothetical protein